VGGAGDEEDERDGGGGGDGEGGATPQQQQRALLALRIDAPALLRVARGERTRRDTIGALAVTPQRSW